MCNLRSEFEGKLTVTRSLTVNLHVIASLLLFIRGTPERAVLGRPAYKEKEVAIKMRSVGNATGPCVSNSSEPTND